MTQDPRLAASAAPQIVIVHGYRAHPDKHWFPWVRANFPDGAVRVVALPDPESPVLDDWLSAASDALSDVDEHTVIIGHSLGCITALHALAALPLGRRVGGVILVAGFTERLPAMPELDAFVREPLAVDALRDRSDRWSVLVSDNDPIVPPAATALLSQQLHAELIEVSGAGHFMADDGVDALPELLPLIAAARADA